MNESVINLIPMHSVWGAPSVFPTQMTCNETVLKSKVNQTLAVFILRSNGVFSNVRSLPIFALKSTKTNMTQSEYCSNLSVEGGLISFVGLVWWLACRPATLSHSVGWLPAKWTGVTQLNRSDPFQHRLKTEQTLGSLLIETRTNTRCLCRSLIVSHISRYIFSRWRSSESAPNYPNQKSNRLGWLGRLALPTTPKGAQYIHLPSSAVVEAVIVSLVGHHCVELFS